MYAPKSPSLFYVFHFHFHLKTRVHDVAFMYDICSSFSCFTELRLASGVSYQIIQEKLSVFHVEKQSHDYLLCDSWYHEDRY